MNSLYLQTVLSRMIGKAGCFANNNINMEHESMNHSKLEISEIEPTESPYHQQSS